MSNQIITNAIVLLVHRLQRILNLGDLILPLLDLKLQFLLNLSHLLAQNSLRCVNMVPCNKVHIDSLQLDNVFLLLADCLVHFPVLSHDFLLRVPYLITAYCQCIICVFNTVTELLESLQNLVELFFEVRYHIYCI